MGLATFLTSAMQCWFAENNVVAVLHTHAININKFKLRILSSYQFKTTTPPALEMMNIAQRPRLIDHKVAAEIGTAQQIHESLHAG